MNTTAALFHDAVRRDDRREVASMLKSGFSVDDADERNHGDTALHAACLRGQYKMTKLLLEAGADEQAKQSSGYTPLHYACLNDRPGCVRLLLESGADPYLRNDAGESALDVAENNQHIACFDLMENAKVPGADKADIRRIMDELKWQRNLLMTVISMLSIFFLGSAFVTFCFIKYRVIF